MDISISYTVDQLKQQMLAALSSRMSSMKFKKTITADNVQLLAVTEAEPNPVALKEMRIIVKVPE